MKTIVAFLLLSVSSHAVDLRVSVGDLEDRRSTGEHFNRLEVKLKLTGDDLSKSEAVKVDVSKAVDDTGRDLLKTDDSFFREEFKPIESSNPNRFEISLDLKNPARKASILAELSGTLSVLMPEADPAAIVTLEDYPTLSAKPITNAALKNAGIEMRLFNKGDNAKLKAESRALRAADRKAKGSGLSGWLKEAVGDAFADALTGNLGSDDDISFLIQDPQKRIVKIEFADRDGKEIRRNSSWRSAKSQGYTFRDGLPPDAKIRIYLSTEKSLVKLPFQFKSIELP